MRVDELIFSKRQFFTELQHLCKKYGASISGCGCCGSPNVFFSDGAVFNHLDVDADGLEMKSDMGEAVFIRDKYHEITVTEDEVYPDGDGIYHYTRYTATCSKCGQSASFSNRQTAVNELEELKCK